MNKKLFIEAIVKFSLGVLLIGLLLFLPAGTLYWSNGWLLMGILFVPMFLAGLVMLAKVPRCCAAVWMQRRRNRSSRMWCV